jgi:hypothetical protein
MTFSMRFLFGARWIIILPPACFVRNWPCPVQQIRRYNGIVFRQDRQKIGFAPKPKREFPHLAPRI